MPRNLPAEAFSGNYLNNNQVSDSFRWRPVVMYYRRALGKNPHSRNNRKTTKRLGFGKPRKPRRQINENENDSYLPPVSGAEAAALNGQMGERYIHPPLQAVRPQRTMRDVGFLPPPVNESFSDIRRRQRKQQRRRGRGFSFDDYFKDMESSANARMARGESQPKVPHIF